jgi:carbon monoxide dehydrogenase subunit G
VEIKGEYQINASKQAVWEALNNPDVLKKCIPGCESLELLSDTEMHAVVMAAIGPVRARFNTKLSLENLQPPERYTLAGESKAGAAGFGRGSADVVLTENENGTLLSYTADFKVGGKLAQVGSRLVVGATKKIANDFFGTFSRELDPNATSAEGAASALRAETGAGSAMISRTWLGVGAAVMVLLIWWFLLR